MWRKVIVSRAWNRFVTIGSPAYSHGGGRERTPTHAQDRSIVSTAQPNRSFKNKQLLQAVYRESES